MKNYFILTSVLALAACFGGGSGGEVVQPTNGRYTLRTNATSGIEAAFAMQESPVVDAHNTSLTGMASYTVSSPANYDTLISYVENKLGDDLFTQENYSNLLRHSTSHRAATARAGSTHLGNSEADMAKKKEIALNKISQMKSVLYNMVNSEDPSNFVNKNRDSVQEALVLFGVTDDVSEMTDSELVTLFTGNNVITKDNIMKQFESFDADKFGFTKETLENVIFESAGEDAKFNFKIDDTGRITNVALVENPSSEYSYNDGQKYVYTPATKDDESSLSRGTNTNSGYRPSKQGWFERDKDTKNFSTTYYEYKITGLGAHNVTGFDQRADLQTLTFYSDKGNLEDEDLKKAAINALLEFGDKLYANQNGENASNDRAKVTAVIKYYADEIDGLSNLAVTPTAISATATLDGLGLKQNLKYADFGYATLTETIGSDSNTMYAPYAGGYDTRRMDQTNANKNLSGAEYNGTVIAAVEHTRKDDTNDYKHDMLVKGNGKLTYNVNGDVASHTLVVTNLREDKKGSTNQWYDVTISGAQGSETPSFKFNGTNKNIPQEYQLFTASSNLVNEKEVIEITSGNDAIKTDGSAAFVLGTDVGGNYRVKGGFDAQYYGADSENPTEATAKFGFSEEWHDNNNSFENEVAIYGAFGGTGGKASE